MRTYESYIKFMAVICIMTLMMLITEGFRCNLLHLDMHTNDKNHHDNSEQNTNELLEIKENKYDVSMDIQSLPRRDISMKVVRRERLVLTEAEKETLYRIVQAEAGGEDVVGKKMVADVIMNRVENEKFPNTIKEVVFQRSGGKVQFAPTKDGRFHSVKITDETINAVKEALIEEDYTDGALYFVATSKAAKDKVSWFERSLTCKGTHGGHTFYQ